MNTPDGDDRDEPPALTPEIVEDDQLLAVAVDAVILADPEARRRAAEIAEHFEWLRGSVDGDTWKQTLDLEERANERFSEVALVLSRWAFNEGVRSGRRSLGAP